MRAGGWWSPRDGILIAVAGALIAVFVGGVIAHAETPRPPAPLASSASGPVEPVEPVEQVAPVVTAPAARVDPAWLARTAAATGIPTRALRAYAGAQLTVAAEQPSCGLGWNTVAAIGAIESDHGRHGGAVLGEDGRSTPAIRGPALDGDGVAAIADTDGGRWDGDAVWDRAVGPMQFIPDTWARWGVDADGDGIADPNQIDDAALATARYLCGAGTMTDADGWRAAVFAYNHLDVYVDDVAALANRYSAAAARAARLSAAPRPAPPTTRTAPRRSPRSPRPPARPVRRRIPSAR